MTLILYLSMLLPLHAFTQFSNDRKLLIFGTPDGKLVTEQLRILKQDEVGVKERDITVTRVDKSSSLWKKYKVGEREIFTIILIGKDGTEKHRTQTLLTAKELFGIIDAMPMRRSEMKKKKSD